MSITQSRNVEYLALGKVAAGAPVATEAISALLDGEIALFSVGGSRLAAAAANDNFIIAVGGSDSKPAFVSEAIKASSVKAISTKAYVAAAEQSDSIGYNGATGSIATLTASNLYMVDVMVQELLTSNTDGRYIKHFQWKSGVVAPTQMDIAYNLVVSGIKNFAREAEDYLQFDIHSDDTGAANTGAGTITLDNGSKVATFGTDVDAVAVVGDFVRFDESAGGATAVTDAVYKVIALDTTNQLMTLDRPYTGTSLSAAAEANAVVITLALANAGAAGLTLTGKPLSFVVGKEQYKQVRWELILKDFGSTASVRASSAYKGTGTYKEIAEKEWFLKGFEGEGYRMGEPTIHSFAGATDSTLTYDTTTIVFEDSSLVGFQNEVSPKQISIASPSTLGASTYMNHANGLWAVLEDLTGITVAAV
jgi:hypothetical protein